MQHACWSECSWLYSLRPAITDNVFVDCTQGDAKRLRRCVNPADERVVGNFTMGDSGEHQLA